MSKRAELILIRHAPAAHGGRLVGRVDVPVQSLTGAEAVRAVLPGDATVICSPALRCRQTAAALFPGQAATPDAALWEQDFGEEDGMRFADLPDLGPLSSAALAARIPPGGESFDAMARRVMGALDGRIGPGPMVVVAHAGTVRAVLGHALGDPALGLRFAIDPLSVTRVFPHPDGWAVGAVNWSPP